MLFRSIRRIRCSEKSRAAFGKFRRSISLFLKITILIHPAALISQDKVNTSAFAFIYEWMITGEPAYTDLNRETVLDIFNASKYLKIKGDVPLVYYLCL